MADSADHEFYQYCNDNDFEDSFFTTYIHWFLIPAIGIIILLSFLEKRKTIRPECWGGRPALVRPLGFLDEPRNRWGIMFVFGSVTSIIISTAIKIFWKKVTFPLWAKIFLVYISCLETSVICYPMFACMTSRHKLVGAILGLLYSIGWLVMELFLDIQIGRCYDKFPDLNVNIAAYILMQELPIVIFDVMVVIKFCWKLYKSLKRRAFKISEEEQVKLCRSYHLTYVKYLLGKHSKNLLQGTESLSLKQKFYRKLTRQVPGFRFPISIMISTFMSGIMLYIVGLYCAAVVEIIAKEILVALQFWDLIKVAIAISTIITILCGLRNIYIFLMNYKRDMLLLYKGDRSFIPGTVKTPSPNVYMAQGLRFIGTSVTGMFWGTVLCFLLVFVPLALMMIVIRILNQRGKLHEIWTQFQWLVYPVCMIIIFKLQTILIGRFFIQPKLHTTDKYRPLAVDNRNAYDVFSFFMIFLNASIGLFAFLKRILVGAFLGVFLIPRMDRSLLMRGYEAMDKCYVNYIGMIMVDVAHNHPVMRVFCFLAKDSAERSRDQKPLQSAVENAEYGNITFSKHIRQETRNTIAKRRWWLAFTLIRNPSLKSTRVRETPNREPENSAVDLRDIDYTDRNLIVTQESMDSWSFTFRCWRNYKFTIPPNIVTNLMALVVLACVLILYAGVAALIADAN